MMRDRSTLEIPATTIAATNVRRVAKAKAKAACAPEDDNDIEPTEAMVEAGAGAIRCYEAGDAEMMAYSSFKAMVRVFRLSHSRDAFPKILSQ